MAALLQGASTNKDKTALYLGEARRMGIKVLSPDVNESVYAYSAVGDVVRFGLGAIRNVGEKAVADIIAERQGSHGRYVNFMDFIRRVPLTALNRRLVESLIKAGAFDSIDPNRRALYQIHEAAIDSVTDLKRKQATGQFDLFADLDAGADDFNAEDNVFEITTDPDAFNDVVKALEEKNYAFVSADISLVPQTYVKLESDEDIRNMEKLLDMLDDNEDVQNTYHNWDQD